MRLKCPGSGVKVAADWREWSETCPTCNASFRLTTHGRLRAHSSYSKDAEIFAKSRKGRRCISEMESRRTTLGRSDQDTGHANTPSR